MHLIKNVAWSVEVVIGVTILTIVRGFVTKQIMKKNIYTCMTFSMWLVKITTLGIFITVKQMKKKSDWFLPNNDSSNFYYCMNHYYSSWNGVNVSEACFFTFVNIKFIVDDLFLLLSPNFLCSNKITIWLVKITTTSSSDAILTSQVVTFTTLLLVLPQCSTHFPYRFP